MCAKYGIDVLDIPAAIIKVAIDFIPSGSEPHFFVSFVLIGTMIVLNLVIGVIWTDMDESNAEMSIKQEMERRNKNPDNSDGFDLQKSLEELSEEKS